MLTVSLWEETLLPYFTEPINPEDIIFRGVPKLNVIHWTNNLRYIFISLYFIYQIIVQISLEGALTNHWLNPPQTF